MKTFLVILGVLAALVLVAWLGLQVPPRPLSPVVADDGAPGEPVALPDDLPPPVARFYQRVYGSEAIHETFLDGRARLELPFGVVEDAPKVEKAANLGLWAEAIWFPAVCLTDPRVRWEGVDDATALLVVPQGDGEQRFVARFDPDTYLLRLLESMRYKNADDARRTLWLNHARAWGDVDGKVVPTEAALTWFDDGEPWAVFRTEEVVYGLAVEERLRERGP